MDGGALQHPLKARRRLGVVLVRGDKVAELVVDIGQDLAAQPVEVDAARAQHRDRVLILSQRQQQMFERSVFMAAIVGMGQRTMQRLFEIA